MKERWLYRQHLNFIQILQRKRQMKKAVVDIVVVMSKHPEDWVAFLSAASPHCHIASGSVWIRLVQSWSCFLRYYAVVAVDRRVEGHGQQMNADAHALQHLWSFWCHSTKDLLVELKIPVILFLEIFCACSSVKCSNAQQFLQSQKTNWQCEIRNLESKVHFIPRQG